MVNFNKNGSVRNKQKKSKPFSSFYSKIKHFTCIFMFIFSYANASTSSNTDDQYIFDDEFIGTHSIKNSIERFNNENQITPGVYSLDIYLNDRYISRGAVRFFNDYSNKTVPCLKADFLEKIGINLERKQNNTDCLNIEEIIPGAFYKIDIPTLTINLYAPQSFINSKPRGYVDPDDLSHGETMAFINYDGSYYSSEFNKNNFQYGFFGMSAGINIGAWRIRSQSNFNYSNNGGYGSTSNFNRIRTYIKRPIYKFKSELMIGEGYTSGSLLGGVGFNGVRLETDSSMLPDSQRNYAPEVRGTANSNARVVISQNGKIIYETSVPPGPFLINDLYGANYSGDLDVKVIESNGVESSFVVPFTSVPESMRPGVSSYSLTFGKTRDYDNNKIFAEAIYQRGINNQFTINTGLQISEGYTSVLGGLVFASRIGAIGFNTTYSSARINNNRNKGWRTGLNYSRTFQRTGTALTLAGYRHSTDGFRELSDAIGASSNISWDSTTYKQKNQFVLSVNQSLGNYGSLYVSGSSSNYYDNKKRDRQLQLGYSNSYKNINYNISYSRQKNTYYRLLGDIGPNLFLGDEVVNTLSISMSIPLGSGSYAPTVTSSISRSSGNHPDNNQTNAQIGLSGSFGENRSSSYALSADYDNEGSASSFSASLQRRMSSSTIGIGASKSKNSKQFSSNIRGALVVHKDGITPGPYVGETFALVEAKGASGALIRGGMGARVNKNGYAVVPSISAYRYNTISLDSKGMDGDAELLETEKKIAPYAGAAVRLKFETKIGKALLIFAKLIDGTNVPIGADVLDEKGNYIGTVGQGGQFYFRSENDKGRLTLEWGDKYSEKCHIDFDISNDKNHKNIYKSSKVCQ